MSNLEAKLEYFAGQTEGLRVLVIAMATLMPDRTALRALTQDLLNSQRELLIAKNVSDEFLAGLDLAGESMLSLIPPIAA